MSALPELRTPLPNAVEVRDLLEGILGRDVDVTTGAAMVNPDGDDGALVGIYVDGRLKLAALVVLDLPLAARVGAAIALTPSSAAEFAIEEGALSPALFDNDFEILNVAASLFNCDRAPHLKLDRCYAPGDPLPADVAQWVLAYVRRLDLDVAIKGYGAGKLSALVL